jgi:hypothetical protein
MDHMVAVTLREERVLMVDYRAHIHLKIVVTMSIIITIITITIMILVHVSCHDDDGLVMDNQ